MPKIAKGEIPTIEPFNPFQTPAQKTKKQQDEDAKREREEWESRPVVPVKVILPINGNEAISYEQLLISLAKDNNFKLVIELRPNGLASLLELLGGAIHNALRAKMFKKAGGACRVCGRVGALELHEVYHYGREAINSEDNRLATLKGLQVVCEACYDAKHLGLEMPRPKQKEVFEHFREVNRCSKYLANEYVQSHIILHAYRSNFVWQQDFDKILPAITAIERELNT